ncbi:MAG TPA: alkaline phosphatase family protein [Stellaceae bacterium]|nr:alkaline phosphatase family protein [Stellaceae bacterium]
MALKDIETVIVVIMENRSFDHMLGYLSLASTTEPMPVDGLRDDPEWQQAHSNLSQGSLYPIHALGADVQRVDDPPHEQRTIALQINTPPAGDPYGKMGGFVDSYATRSPPPGDHSRVMGYYTDASVPLFDFFARNFVVCDRWFSALPTGTQANRLMAMSGESSIVDNAPVYLPAQDLVYDWLTAHGVPWCAYQSGDFFPFFSLMPDWLPEITTSLTLSDLGGRGRFRRYSMFDAHWHAGDPMPSVIFIEPEYTDGPNGDPNDDHPPTGVAKGQAFLADIYRTLISNPERWRNTMMIVTYDEHGGFFDHVPPLPIATNVGGFQFTTTGVRVPAFVISPLVPSGSVFSGNLDHTSILQMLADRFNPNQDYSAAVGVRQPQLVRLATVLPDEVPQSARAPAIPAAALAAIDAAAAVASSPARGVEAPGAAANAQALNNVAAKAVQDHPDLMARPGWDPVRNFVSTARADR